MRESGTTILECLVAIGMAAAAASVLYAGASGWRRACGAALGALHDHAAAAALSGAVRAGVRAQAASRLPYAVTLAPSSVEPLPNGAPHPLSRMRGASSPRPGSAVVTFLELDPGSRGTVQASSGGPSQLVIEVCGLSAAATGAAFRSYVALGPSGDVQVSGSLARAATGCATLRGAAVPGIVSDPAHVLPSSLSSVAGVLREYSLFVDNSGQLRLASHLGTQVLENQPIVAGLDSFQARWLRSSWGAVGVALEIRGAHGLSSSDVAPLSLTAQWQLGWVL